MQQVLRSVAQANGGFFCSADAVRCGAGANEIRGLVRAGTCQRVRRDLFVFNDDWPTRPAERHAVLARGIIARYEGRIAPSLHTALILQDLATWGVPYERPSFVRIAGGHTETTPTLRIGPSLPEDALTPTSDGVMVKPGLAGILTAMAVGVEAAVVPLDDALARDLTDREELRHWLTRLRGQRYYTRGVRAVELADHRSESPGESRLRVRLIGLGFADLEPQVVIRIGSQVLGRVDLYDRARRIAIEFDGALKYSGAEGQRALMREKVREDQLRSYGVGFVRFVWRDLERPEVLRTKMQRAIRAAAKR
jgi:hypothetical protein